MSQRRVPGRRLTCPRVVLIAVASFGLAGCSGGLSTPTAAGTGVAAPVGSSGVSPVSTPTSATPGSTVSPKAEPAESPAAKPPSTKARSTKAPSTKSKPPSKAPDAADRLAGLRSNTMTWTAGGHLITVPGHSSAPGKGRIYTVQVQVESGLDVDRGAFAKFVLATLNDKRSWTEHGRRRFARTDHGSADIRVVLASPATSAAMCLPLRTFGKLSCHAGGNTAVLTYYRWVKAIPEYAGDHDGYRRYVINHEVGHVLGHGHQYCAGRGRLAPLMMQQTKGLKGCRPNPWPFP